MRKLTLEEIKQIELNILLSFDSYCRENRLTYFLCGGTLLGAIRHQGFIPWDNDIDVFMPRPDYEAFKRLAVQSPIGEGLVNCSYDSETNTTIYPFMKIIDIRTYVKEENIPSSKAGIWIDIFPIDGLSDSVRENQRLYRKNLHQKHLFRAATNNTHYTRNLIKKLTLLVAKPFFSRYNITELCRKMDSNAKKYDYSTSSSAGVVIWGYGMCEIMRREELSPVQVSFEGHSFPAPACYDYYLTSLYGDYMRLPPRNKRISHKITAYALEGGPVESVAGIKKKNDKRLVASKICYKCRLNLPGRLISKSRISFCMSLLERAAFYFLKKDYSFDSLEQTDSRTSPIFVMWLQGEEQMPAPVKMCYSSIKRGAGQHPVHLITQDNLQEYLDMPREILEKHNAGEISHAFFSDIVRSGLLYTYGGTWIDSTVFLSGDLPEEYFQREFFSPSGFYGIKLREWKYLFGKSHGWSAWFMGTNKKHYPLFDFTYHFYLSYFKSFDTIIDYFQNDFSIALFYKNNRHFYEYLNRQEANNRSAYRLACLMNRPYRNSVLNFLEDNIINKLTYKRSWSNQTTGGARTVFAELKERTDRK